MKGSLLPWLLAPALLLVSGCATRYELRVDALSAAEAPGRGLTYVLASETAGVAEDDLFFKEVARHLHAVLTGLGYQPAPAGAAADLRIGVGAYLSAPLLRTETTTEPVFVETWGHSHVVRVPVLDEQGRVVRYVTASYWSPPRTTLAGTVQRDRQVTVFDKVLRLSARPLRADGSTGPEAWVVSVALRGTDTDYRAALPYLLVAARPWIGRRTEGEERILLRKDAPEVQQFRASLPHAR